MIKNVSFLDNPILNSPYECPQRHWDMDADNHPTGKITECRRLSSLRTPIAPPKGKIQDNNQLTLEGIIDKVDDVEYATNALINSIREAVKTWRELPEEQWHVTSETARLLKHWRTFDFPMYRPFFCQIEAVETLIWLTEVAPSNPSGKKYLQQIGNASNAANPGLCRIALKLATGAGKTTVMAMIIAWQTINAQRQGINDRYTKGFLVTTPGLTIKDRLRVLMPNDPESYYKIRHLVPADLLPLMENARVVITNYHAYMLSNTLKLSSGTKAMLIGPTDNALQTMETPGQMLRRVIPDLIGLKNIMMINDEAHHCYRHRPLGQSGEETSLDADEKDEVKRNEETARVWITGLEAIRALMPKSRVIDLSATPFFLSGSGYQEGTLFPWTVSDFSLLDALECGIVKLPRIPTDDNVVTDDQMPIYRDLWKNIRQNMPKSSRGKGGANLNPQSLPALLQTAISVLYNHYEKTFNVWQEAGISTPPCFIFVCQNTAISKLVYDFVSGYVVKDANGDARIEKAACPLFSNFEADGEPLARPNTLLVDSIQLDSGDNLSSDFLVAAEKEIELYKRELITRTGDRAAADKLSEAGLLREVMNTVGKEGQLGGNIRCVVSVSMLTEGWDANTVTHILGIRAFGTQLLCEQVVGRALRRLSYEKDAETGHYHPEYADIFGIPFDFVSKGVKGTSPEPPDFVHVYAVHPDRDHLEIKFPRVIGYYLEHQNSAQSIGATFTDTSAISITRADIGPTQVLNSGFVGTQEMMTLGTGHMRASDIVANLTTHFIKQYYMTKDFTDMDRTVLFTRIKPLFTRWLNEGYLRCESGINPDAVVRYKDMANNACERVKVAIIRDAMKDNPGRAISVLIDDYLPTGSTHSVNFRMSRKSKQLHETNPDKSHVNYAVLDSGWEGILCQVLEEHKRTIAYVKNYNLGFEVPYIIHGERHNYLPDFIVLVDDGRGTDDPLHLVVEVKGYRYEDADIKKETMQTYWIPGVNVNKSYGRWAFIEMNEKDFTLDSGGTTDVKRKQLCAQAYAEYMEELICM